MNVDYNEDVEDLKDPTGFLQENAREEVDNDHLGTRLWSCRHSDKKVPWRQQSSWHLPMEGYWGHRSGTSCSEHLQLPWIQSPCYFQWPSILDWDFSWCRKSIIKRKDMNKFNNDVTWSLIAEAFSLGKDSAHCGWSGAHTENTEL